MSRSSPTKKQGEGTGLGLALAEQIISTHRGHILAESTLGQGTTFYIYLPVLEQQRALEQVQWGVDHKLRILAADDNKKVLNLLEKDFGRFGLEVLTCSAGARYVPCWRPSLLTPWPSTRA